MILGLLQVSGNFPLSCEISALAMEQRIMYIKARDENSHVGGVSGILKDRGKVWGERKNLEMLQGKEKGEV